MRVFVHVATLQCSLAHLSAVIRMMAKTVGKSISMIVDRSGSSVAYAIL